MAKRERRMEETMKGYKIFNEDWKCQGFQYEVGKTYEMDGGIELCRRGFHFCEKLEECFNFYEAVTWNHIAEVEALGATKTDGNKTVTNKIKIIKEIQLKDGVNGSDGVNRSDGVNWSYGVNRSYGILNSYGVDGQLFLSNKPRTHGMFGTTITEGRFNLVMNIFKDNLGGWNPTFNNLKSLYVKHGSDWKKTPIPKAGEISKEEAWEDMPIVAIEYLETLPEFDADMFFEITGIDRRRP